MKIHEYQGKEIFRNFSIPTPKGYLIEDIAEAERVVSKAQKDFKTEALVIKAQIHAGGRGKGGGVKVSQNYDSAISNIKAILGMNLVTHQTGSSGQKVKKVYVEEASSIKSEFYCAITLDRNTGQDVFMVSTEGGVETEKVADETPEKIVKTWIDPLIGMKSYQARKLAFGLKLEGGAFKECVNLLQKLYKCYIDTDASLVEINPLVLTSDDSIMALDAKFNFDNNALYRQSNILSLRDLDEEDPTEVEAGKYDLNYISLDGNIGCMVNGAGLAMATMDIIKLEGGSPANFLDVGGGASKERVEQAFRIILSDKKVKAVLINIFGGIMRCDVIAEGVVAAAKNIDIKVPLIVRLAGTNEEKGKEILNNSGLDIISANNLGDAAKKAVQSIKEQ